MLRYLIYADVKKCQADRPGIGVEGVDAGDRHLHGAVGHEGGRPAQVLGSRVAPTGELGPLVEGRLRGHDGRDGLGGQAQRHREVDVLRAVAVEQLGHRRRRRSADPGLQALAVGDRDGSQGADRNILA